MVVVYALVTSLLFFREGKLFAGVFYIGLEKRIHLDSKDINANVGNYEGNK